MANKKLKSIFFIALIAVLLSFSIPSLAVDTTYKHITVTYSNIGLNVNGQSIVATDSGGKRVDPFAYNGTTYLPLRAVAGLFNINVNWNPVTKTVTLTDKTSPGAVTSPNTASAGITGTKNISVAYMGIKINVNGSQAALSAEPFSYNGTVYLPIRALGTVLGKDIHYTNKIIYITAKTPVLEVHFIDVGQGDSILIEYGKFQALIDAGDNSAEATVVDYLESQKVDDLELFVATHSDADHIGGADAVLDQFDAQFIVDCEWLSDTASFNDYKTAMIKNSADEKTSYRINDNDLYLTMNPDGSEPAYTDANADVYLKIIGNPDNEDANNSSTVVLLNYYDTHFLFMGDLEAKGEADLMAEFSDINVLKVGHHGSSTSSSWAFLNKVLPEYAVISVGADNDYGHPTQAVLDRLTAIGAAIYRTDEDGTIIFTSDGKKLTVRTAVGSVPPTTPATPVVATTSKNVIISSVDKKAELVTIKNTGASDVSLTGWKLVSVTGNQSYTFPAYTLKAGATVTVASGGTSGTLVWTTANIWNNSDPDPARLYDANGNLISSYGG